MFAFKSLLTVALSWAPWLEDDWVLEQAAKKVRLAKTREVFIDNEN